MRDAETLALYQAHVAELIRRANDGDEFSAKTVGCLAWLVAKLGPSTPPPTDGGVEFTTFEGDVVDMAEWMRRRAA